MRKNSAPLDGLSQKLTRVHSLYGGAFLTVNNLSTVAGRQPLLVPTSWSTMQKPQRTPLSLAKKITRLNRLDNGASITEMMQMFSCSRHTVLNIKSQRSKIEELLKSSSQNFNSETVQPVRFHDIEEHLYASLQIAMSAKLSIFLFTLRIQALLTSENLLNNGPDPEALQRLQSFTASQMWVLSFAKRHS